MSLEAFPVDPGLPQLKNASDPRLMREVFRRHLRPLTKKAYQIKDCFLSRVRYRRADRAILQYTLRLVEPRTGRERSQWVTGVIYEDDRARRNSERLQAAHPRQEVPEAFVAFEPVSYIPELRMLVQVFPYDRRLPTLPLLMAGPSPDLEPVLLSRFGPGDWRAELWSTEPIRYRAGLGAVLRWTVQARDAAAGRKEEKRLYVKVYRDDEGERTHQVLQALRERPRPGGESFTVGQPMAYLGGLQALILEEVPGISLQQVLFQDRDPVAAARKVARALAALHLDYVSLTRHHLLQNEVAALKKVGQLLSWACPHLKEEVGAIIGGIVQDLEEVPPAPTHRDLKADHILLDGDRLALLDLDWFAKADPVLDPATLLATLAGMPFRFPLPHDRVRMAARAFAEEYFTQVPRAWRSRIPLHYAGAALKVAVGFFRRQEPRWPETIATLVDEAKNSLAGKIW